MYLYHGSNNTFNEFKIGEEFTKKIESDLAEGYGIYLVEDETFARSYGDKIYVISKDNNDITDFTKDVVINEIICSIGKKLSINLNDYFDTKHIVEMVSSGNYSSLGLGREIELFLDSNEQFYNRNDSEYILKNIQGIFSQLIKDTIKYYDKSFDCEIYVCHRNPNNLKIENIINI